LKDSRSNAKESWDDCEVLGLFETWRDARSFVLNKIVGAKVSDNEGEGTKKAHMDDVEKKIEAGDPGYGDYGFLWADAEDVASVVYLRIRKCSMTRKK
jgi:hypothetical protein